MRLAPLLVALAAAGCTILAPRPDPSRFFTLSAVESDGGAPPPERPIAVGLGPVRVPAYLDRPELATRVSATELKFAATERWAEPLGASLRRVLGRNLALALGAEDVATHPWPVGAPLDWAVAVDVLRFERTPGGEVEVAARWVVRDPASGEKRLARETRVTRRADGPGPDAAVAAWNEALAELSREIAAGVASLGPRDGTGGGR